MSIPAENDRVGKTTKGIPSSGAAESGFPIRSTVVAGLLARVERCQLHVMQKSQQGNTTIYSDASGSWGFVAWCQPRLRWFQGAWPLAWQSTNITAKELLPIVLAAAIWGPQWRGQAVHFCQCDNAAIVHTIASSRSTEPLVMQLLRGLHLFAMEEARRGCSSAMLAFPHTLEGMDIIILSSLWEGT